MKIRDILVLPSAKILLVLLDGPKNDKEIVSTLKMSSTTYNENITWLLAHGFIQKIDSKYSLTDKAKQQLVNVFLPLVPYIERLKELAITTTT
ncbi:transcriptional regulator [Acidianus manzaensis]|uniref:Transcriptional regulator n=1 Tax=Acidianus manzaensis TaxID=282676 RepID=A0A1W6K0R9_9CREN|nr:transcriptional regulator [Acidianus manzaensis]ARM76116.1 transcriptional regulator [Acidianus manzaensis]